VLITAVSACERYQRAFDAETAVIAPAESTVVDFTIVDVAIEGNLRTVAIADGDNQRIVLVDLHSDRRLVVGREGDGPCEFRHLSTIAFIDSTTLAVTDAKGGLIALCSLDGTHNDVIRIPGSASRVARDADGPLRVAVVSGDDSVLALATSSLGEPLDTTAIAAIQKVGDLVGPRPRAPVLAPLTDGRLAFGSRDGGYAIALANSDGVHSFATRTDPPARYSEEQVEAVERRTMALLARTGRPVPARGFMRADTLPLKPRFTGRVFALTPGILWALASADTGSSTLDRFRDPEGTLIERDKIPEGADGIVIRDTILVAWRRNTDGTSVVMHWAIDTATGAIRTP
jgi:hypothetical protein